MYQHTQRSPALFLLMLVGALIPIAVIVTGVATGAPLGMHITLLATVLILLTAGIAFSSFTIMVREGQLSWWFGPGVVKKTVPLSTIASAEPTTTHFYEGWGIHYTMRGWLYNIAGNKAVLVTQTDGKRFLLGTDEPEHLAQVILDGARFAR